MPPKHIHRYKGVVTVPQLQGCKGSRTTMVSASHLSNSHTLHAWRRTLYAWSLHDEFSSSPCVFRFASNVFLAPQHHRAHQLFIHTAAAMAPMTKKQMTKPIASSMSTPMPSAILSPHRNLNMASTLHWHADTCFERHPTFYRPLPLVAQTGANWTVKCQFAPFSTWCKVEHCGEHGSSWSQALLCLLGVILNTDRHARGARWL